MTIKKVVEFIIQPEMIIAIIFWIALFFMWFGLFVM